MIDIWLYSLGSVVLVSLVSLIGIATLTLSSIRLQKVLLLLVSFSAAALFGDAFIHLLPEAAKEGFTTSVALYTLLGIGTAFIVEKVIHFRHTHRLPEKNGPHPFALMNLFGDAIHNFIDGLIIAGSYIASIPLGIATTFAVVLHEIPQEFGDFGVLIHGGFTKKKALLSNFFTALTAVLGAIIALVLSSYMENLTGFLIPFAAGGFIYIAGSDLIPELHREVDIKKSLLQIIAFILGIAVMLALLLFE